MKIYPIKRSPAPHTLIYFFFVLYGHLFLFLYKEPLTNILMGLTSPIQVDNFQKKKFNLIIHFLLWYEVGAYLILFQWFSMMNFIWFGGKVVIKDSSLQPVSHLFLSLSHTLSFTFLFLYKIKFSLPISFGLYLYFVVRT